MNGFHFVIKYSIYLYLQWFFSSVKLGNDKILLFSSLVNHLYVMLAKDHFNNEWYYMYNHIFWYFSAY